MTPLKTEILHALKKDGPLSDLGVWCKLGDQETGGFAAIVVIANLELQNAGLIEPTANNPHEWQLSNIGLEYVAREQAEMVGA